MSKDRLIKFKYNIYYNTEMMNDQVLMKYISEVFGYYDVDRSGFLTVN